MTIEQADKIIDLLSFIYTDLLCLTGFLAGFTVVAVSYKILKIFL